MRLFKKVAIVGVGLIGGSLGLAIKKRKLANKVVGVCRHSYTLKEAIQKKAIDSGSLDLRIIKGADLVILATPVSAILRLAPRIVKMLGKGSVVMDVGSTKEVIAKKIKTILPKDIYFIGSHPLAGSEKRTAKFAQPDLFNNSICIITMSRDRDLAVVNKIKRFWTRLGARVEVISAAKHDEILASTSHLPHILAFSLVSTPKDSYLKYAAGGFKDMTRIASSDPVIWRDIFLTNGSETLKALKRFKIQLDKLALLIAKKDARGIARVLKTAKSRRDAL